MEVNINNLMKEAASVSALKLANEHFKNMESYSSIDWNNFYNQAYNKKLSELEKKYDPSEYTKSMEEEVSQLRRDIINHEIEIEKIENKIKDILKECKHENARWVSDMYKSYHYCPLCREEVYISPTFDIITPKNTKI